MLGAPGLADRLVQCGGSYQLLQDTRFSERDSTYFSSGFGLKLCSIDFFKFLSLPPGKKTWRHGKNRESQPGLEGVGTKYLALVLRHHNNNNKKIYKICRANELFSNAVAGLTAGVGMRQL